MAFRRSFDRVREAVARAAHGKAGKVVRFPVKSGAGLLPGAALLGAGLGALDSFLVEDIVDRPGHYSFISDAWPSLFHGT